MHTHMHIVCHKVCGAWPDQQQHLVRTTQGTLDVHAVCVATPVDDNRELVHSWAGACEQIVILLQPKNGGIVQSTHVAALEHVAAKARRGAPSCNPQVVDHRASPVQMTAYRDGPVFALTACKRVASLLMQRTRQAGSHGLPKTERRCSKDPRGTCCHYAKVPEIGVSPYPVQYAVCRDRRARACEAGSAVLVEGNPNHASEDPDNTLALTPA
jgi:hypothetical protein